MTDAVRVRITYCAECGYEDQALELARTLMLAFGAELAAIEIIPFADGTFDVRVGTELVHSMTRDGGFPEPDAVVGAVRVALGGG